MMMMNLNLLTNLAYSLLQLVVPAGPQLEALAEIEFDIDLAHWGYECKPNKIELDDDFFFQSFINDDDELAYYNELLYFAEEPEVEEFDLEAINFCDLLSMAPQFLKKESPVCDFKPILVDFEAIDAIELIPGYVNEREDSIALKTDDTYTLEASAIIELYTHVEISTIILPTEVADLIDLSSPEPAEFASICEEEDDFLDFQQAPPRIFENPQWEDLFPGEIFLPATADLGAHRYAAESAPIYLDEAPAIGFMQANHGAQSAPVHKNSEPYFDNDLLDWMDIIRSPAREMEASGETLLGSEEPKKKSMMTSLELEVLSFLEYLASCRQQAASASKTIDTWLESARIGISSAGL